MVGLSLMKSSSCRSERQPAEHHDHDAGHERHDRQLAHERVVDGERDERRGDERPVAAKIRPDAAWLGEEEQHERPELEGELERAG